MGFIALSFDDGKAEDFLVMDVLNKFNIPATFYICAARLVEKDLASKFYGTSDIKSIIKRYQELNCEIGCHGYKHLNMAMVDKSHWKVETIKAKEILEGYFGPVVSYAFPYGLATEHFSRWVASSKWFESMRLYQTPIQFNIPGIVATDGLICEMNTAVLTKSHLHIAGHSHELLKFPKTGLNTFIKTALDEGYRFTTVNMMTRKQRQ